LEKFGFHLGADALGAGVMCYLANMICKDLSVRSGYALVCLAIGPRAKISGAHDY